MTIILNCSRYVKSWCFKIQSEKTKKGDHTCRVWWGIYHTRYEHPHTYRHTVGLLRATSFRSESYASPNAKPTNNSIMRMYLALWPANKGTIHLHYFTTCVSTCSFAKYSLWLDGNFCHLITWEWKWHVAAGPCLDQQSLFYTDRVCK